LQRSGDVDKNEQNITGWIIWSKIWGKKKGKNWIGLGL